MKRSKIYKKSINKMMEIAGYSVRYKDLPKADEVTEEEKENPWFERYTWTEEQRGSFKSWFMEKMGKELGDRAESKMEWFLFTHGLKVEN